MKRVKKIKSPGLYLIGGEKGKEKFNHLVLVRVFKVVRGKKTGPRYPTRYTVVRPYEWDKSLLDTLAVCPYRTDMHNSINQFQGLTPLSTFLKYKEDALDFYNAFIGSPQNKQRSIKLVFYKIEEYNE